MIWTTKAINDSVSIVAGVNDTLTIDVDGNIETIILDEGEYGSNYNRHWSTLIDEFNKQFTSNSISVEAKLGGIFGDEDVLRKCVVVFKHTKNGYIGNLGGSILSVIVI